MAPTITTGLSQLTVKSTATQMGKSWALPSERERNRTESRGFLEGVGAVSDNNTSDGRIFRAEELIGKLRHGEDNR